MSRGFIILAAISALAGCYNPPYPPDSAGVGPLPQQTGSAPDTSIRPRRRSRGVSSPGVLRLPFPFPSSSTGTPPDPSTSQKQAPPPPPPCAGGAPPFKVSC